MKFRPEIGVAQPGGAFHPAFFLINVGIFLAGGAPRKITPHTPGERSFDGLVLGGGTDIFPELFKARPIPDYRYDADRDKMEMRWLEIAEERRLPVLGICRGAQMINVMNGGTLHLSVREAYEDAIYPEDYWSYLVFRKTMRIEPETRLARILAPTPLPGELHAQAGDRQPWGAPHGERSRGEWGDPGDRTAGTPILSRGAVPPGKHRLGTRQDDPGQLPRPRARRDPCRPSRAL
ncbi:MAG: C26 family cysteine hydrolase domain-containing family [Verrucomicrobiae bacterium]|nr:C26 family cysteine hydrolase domain-containing family [Verrucomicrobiae bacterium]